MRTLRVDTTIDAPQVSENLVNHPAVNAALQPTMVRKNRLVVEMAWRLAQLKADRDKLHAQQMPLSPADMTKHDRIEGAMQAMKFVITTIESAT